MPSGGKLLNSSHWSIFWSDGTVTFEDIKGFRTDLYRTKKKMVEATYPFKIVES